MSTVLHVLDAINSPADVKNYLLRNETVGRRDAPKILQRTAM